MLYELLKVLKKELVWRGFTNQKHQVIHTGGLEDVSLSTQIKSINSIVFSGRFGGEYISIEISRNKLGQLYLPEPYHTIHNTHLIPDKDLFLHYRFMIVNESLSIVSRGLEKS